MSRFMARQLPTVRGSLLPPDSLTRRSRETRTEFRLSRSLGVLEGEPMNEFLWLPDPGHETPWCSAHVVAVSLTPLTQKLRLFDRDEDDERSRE